MRKSILFGLFFFTVLSLSSCTNINEETSSKTDNSNSNACDYYTNDEPDLIGAVWSLCDNFTYKNSKYVTEDYNDFQTVEFDELLCAILNNDEQIPTFRKYYPELDYIIDSRFEITLYEGNTDLEWFLIYSIKDIDSEISLALTNSIEAPDSIIYNREN